MNPTTKTGLSKEAEKFWRESLDRADALSNAMAKTIDAQDHALRAYQDVIGALHKEIARLESLLDEKVNCR
jgi:hypothetical protein